MAIKLSYSPIFMNLTNRHKFFSIHCEHRKANFSCVICDDILIEPRQSECGYRFCNPCLNRNIKDIKTFCPGCKDITKSIQCSIIHDKAVEKEIFALEMICINKGCKEKFKLRELPAHLEQCEYREGKCIECDELYPFKEAEDHRSIYCKMIVTTCNNCGAEMTKKDYTEKHKNATGNIDWLCDHWMDICPMKCSEEIQSNIKVHLNNCPQMPIECAMRRIGCTKMILRVDMDDHIKNDAWHHIKLMAEELKRLKTENEDLKYKHLKYDRALNTEINQLKQTIVTSSSSIDTLKQKLTVCDNNYSDAKNEAKILKRFLLQRSPLLSRCGEFTWRIDKIYDKISDAKSGINKQILSEPFYSHYRGHKMCLKIYPNGDGTGLGNYLSLYFAIMKGEYDDDLSWPFCQKISLSLLSNKRGKDDSTVTMKPDANNECYGKPTRQYNLAAGQPLFVRHTELRERKTYVDDCGINIRVTVG